MMMLGVVLHSATLYLAAPPPHLPLTTDPNTSLAMDALFDFIHSFRMPTFFVLAGFFASLLVEKRGLWGTYKNRAARILGPLVAGMLTVLPLAVLFMLDFTFSVRYGVHEALPSMDNLRRFERESSEQGIPTGIFLGHLWFLYYLCYFYLLIPFCRLLEGKLTRLLASPLVFFVFGLYTSVTLWPYPGGQVFGEFLFLRPDPAALLYYGSFFVFGYVFHFHREFLQGLTRHVRWCAVLALFLFPLSVYASHLEYADPTVGNHVVAIVAHGFCTWALIWLFIGCALRFFDRPSPWILYASQSSYWVFLLHLPVVCFVAWVLVPYDVPAIAKFLAVATVTTVVCFVTYHYWVQNTWVSDFLNGRRFDLDWPWRAA
jgi:glucan biosynthesis protein C